jgi:hypothetical protein
VGCRIDAITAYSGLQPLRLNALETSLRGGWWAVARRFGVTHVVLGRRFRPEDLQASALAVANGQRVFRQSAPPIEVWAVPHAPWASFASRSRAAGSPGEALRLVVESTDADDFGAVVVEAPADPLTAPGRILGVSRGIEELRVDAEAAGEALLVVRDAYWPGWRAWIDGFEVPIYAADLLVRAVPWPTGRHTLVMRYEPREVRVGWALTALGAMAMAALGIAGVRGARAPEGDGR